MCDSFIPLSYATFWLTAWDSFMCDGTEWHKHVYEWHKHVRAPPSTHRRLRLVGSLKLYVSFAKEPYKRAYILQKRHIFYVYAPPSNHRRKPPVCATHSHVICMWLIHTSFICDLFFWQNWTYFWTKWHSFMRISTLRQNWTRFRTKWHTCMSAIICNW